jgi:hypothetical protein
MKQNKAKYNLDFLPLLILIISAVILITTVIKENTFFLPKHIIALVILVLDGCFFIWRHRIGVLSLGLTLVLGLFGVLSFNYSIAIHTFYVGKNEDSQIPIFYGQPIFILWLILHFVISSRYYEGVFSKKCWMDLLDT